MRLNEEMLKIIRFLSQGAEKCRWAVQQIQIFTVTDPVSFMNAIPFIYSSSMPRVPEQVHMFLLVF